MSQNWESVYKAFSHQSYKQHRQHLGFAAGLSGDFVGFLLCLLWYTTAAAVRAVLGISPHTTKVCGLKLWKAELDTIKGINYRQACNGAIGIVWKRSSGLSGKKGSFWQKTHLRVSRETPHMCVRLHLGCLNRWKTQTRLGKQWIEMWSCLLIVLTAQSVFQSNKHFIIVTN